MSAFNLECYLALQKHHPLMMHGTVTDLNGECCKHGLHCTHPIGHVVIVYITCQYFGMSPTSWSPVGLCVYMAHTSLNTYMAATVRPVLLPKLFGDCGVQLCWWMPMIWTWLNNNTCFVKLDGLMQYCIVIADLVWIIIVVLCLTCNLSFSCSITNLASWSSSNKISHILP